MPLFISGIVMLKSELAALDRKITSELAPTHEAPDDHMGVNHDENDGTENKQEQSQHMSEVKAGSTVKTIIVNTPDPPQVHKPSMVAEPLLRYSSNNRSQTFRSI